MKIYNFGRGADWLTIYFMIFPGGKALAGSFDYCHDESETIGEIIESERYTEGSFRVISKLELCEKHNEDSNVSLVEKESCDLCIFIDNMVN